MDKRVINGILIFAVGLFAGIFLTEQVVDTSLPESAQIASEPIITLDSLDKQCELTIWTQEGSDTYVPIKMKADDIIYQIKGTDAVPNGLYPSYYQVKGLSLNGNPVLAITGFMPESDGE